MKVIYEAVVLGLLFYKIILANEVLINQIGYLPNLPKYVYCTSFQDSFYVIEVSSQTVYFRGAFHFLTNYDPSTGLTLYKGDFSSLNREGSYYIKTSSNIISFNFAIASNIYNEVFRKSLKSFYFQRCGSALVQGNAGIFNRQICHTVDAFFHPSTSQNGFHESIGGWHDAGDYGKYVVNSGITIGTLLMAYELAPEKFDADDLNIPESGNSIPDILDEIKYEISWLLKMQHSNGGVYFKLTPEQFEPFVMPALANSTRYIYELSTTATGNFIAVTSRFSRMFRPYDSTFANQCLLAAENAWNYLTNQQGIVPPGGFHNPPGTGTGVYGDGSDADERLWAAAELFETTGQLQYRDYFDFNYDLNGVFNSTMWWGQVYVLAQLTYLSSQQRDADAAIKSILNNSLQNYCNLLVSRRNSNGLGVTLNPGEYIWGSNSTVLNNSVLLIFAYEISGNQNFLFSALDQLNYVLGINGHNFSFVSGVGTNSLTHPHHRPSASDGVVEPIPGLLAGGPDEYLSDPVLQQNFNSTTPPAMCYIDDVGSYASNEIAINWNAPLVFATGYFSHFQLTGAEEEFGLLSPNRFKLFQNFPNPFNPRTTISFYKSIPSIVQIKVYNSLGQEVAIICNEFKPSGYNSVNFNASELSSGIYFYKIFTEAHSEIMKMVLIK